MISKNFINRFFPTPVYLARSSFGLDISDESLKYIRLRSGKNGIKIDKYGEKKIPQGVIENGNIKNPTKMREVLLSLRKEEGIKSVRVSLPENQIYLFRVRLDKAGLTNVRESIELSLEEHIPVPAEEIIFDYTTIDEDNTSLQLQVAAIPTVIIENYLTVFKDAGISVQSVEVEAQAIARSVIKHGDKDAYMIVDFGEKKTGIFIVSKGIAMFSSTLDFGGSMIDTMVEKTLGIAQPEAEEIKKKYGLQRNLENKDIFPVILNSVSILRDEVSKHFIYWHTHKDEEGKDNQPIKKILLCGGDSNLIGLGDYLAVSLKTRVEMANVWVNILDTNQYVPEIGFKQALSFAAALGLALGDFEYD